jgi:hypothetical protein
MRLIPVLLAALLLPTAAACGGGDGVDKQASCDKMKNAIKSIGTLQAEESEKGDADFAKIYTDVAAQIRSAASSAEDEGVKSAGTQVADALDELAKAQSSGQPGGTQALEASGKLATAAGAFEKHCGPVEN